MATTSAAGRIASATCTAVAARDLEPLGVDVVQHEAQRRQIGEPEEVGEQLPGEDDAARAEEDDAESWRDPAGARDDSRKNMSEFALK